jgi:hypothetical protein
MINFLGTPPNMISMDFIQQYQGIYHVFMIKNCNHLSLHLLNYKVIIDVQNKSLMFSD